MNSDVSLIKIASTILSSREIFERNYSLRETAVGCQESWCWRDIGTNMKPVQRKYIGTNKKIYWNKYEKILRQIWKDIGTNMKPVQRKDIGTNKKKYWDKYEKI